MKNLHAIVGGRMEAMIWAYVSGGNGRDIGAINGRTTAHAFRAQRGTPPQMAPTNRYSSRPYWTPFQFPDYNMSAEQILTPACGRLRSSARYPRISTAYEGGWNTNFCPVCLRIAPDTRYHRAVMMADPWIAIPQANRSTTLDPVSGV